MNRFVLSVVLTSILSASALAGEIPTGGIAPPPTGGTTQTASSTAPGDIPSVGYAEELSSTALSALLTVVGLLS